MFKTISSSLKVVSITSDWFVNEDWKGKKNFTIHRGKRKENKAKNFFSFFFDSIEYKMDEILYILFQMNERGEEILQITWEFFISK